MKRLRIVIVIVVVVGLVGACSQSQPQTDQTTTATPDSSLRRLSKDREEDRSLPIEKADIGVVYPTADGGAYIVSVRGRIWYAKGDRATRVTESSATQTGLRRPVSPNAASFALLSIERQRVHELLSEAARLQEKLDEAEARRDDNRYR